jgi:thioesterase domain-containing protein
LDGELVPHSSVESAALFYLEAIQRFPLEYGIHLLGHSFGGWVVLEMARQLQRMGHVIASVTILDSEAPDDGDYIIREFTRTDTLMKWMEIFELILERPIGITLEDLKSRDDAAQRKLLHACLIREGLMPTRSEHDILRGPLRSFAMALRTHYKPDSPFVGSVHLVFADDHRLDHDANRRKQEALVERWRRWAPNLTYAHTPGNHMTVLKPPFVEALACLIRQYLETVSQTSAQDNLYAGHDCRLPE